MAQQNITVDDAVNVTWTSDSILTLTAGNDILLNGSTFTGNMGGMLVLNFGNMLDLGSASLSLNRIDAIGMGAGTQTIQGQNVNTTWTITNNGDGTVTAGGGAQSIFFSGVENLTGGSADGYLHRIGRTHWKSDRRRRC